MHAVNDDVLYGLVLGKVIARLREDQRLTQTELAHQVGVPQSRISRIEAGTIPDALTLQRIASTLKVSTDQLHAWTVEGVENARKAARTVASDPDNGAWVRSLLGAVGVAALAGLAVFAVAAIFADDVDSET
ncbi:MAG: XRE family transcriptional regulator [Deltaproteobacteria bacterium]|nr:MAG: XRE family transcriptional regulator [Deltaproteobacteria bacterium]